MVDKWLEVIRQLEIHGEGYKLSGVFKITALKSMMVGKAKDMFEIWEQDEKIKSERNENMRFGMLLSKVRDYASKEDLRLHKRKVIPWTLAKSVMGGGAQENSSQRIITMSVATAGRTIMR